MVTATWQVAAVPPVESAVPYQLAHKMSKALIALPLLLVAQKLDWTDENVVFYARAAFVVGQAVSILLFFLAKQAAEKNKDNTRVWAIMTPNPLGGLFGGASGAGKYEATTLAELDMKHASEGLRNAMNSTLMIGLLVYYMNVQVPLVINAVTAPVTAFTSPVVRRMLFGNKEKGQYNEEYTRPAGTGEVAATDASTTGASQEGSATDAGSAVQPAKLAEDWDEVIWRSWEHKDAMDMGTIAGMVDAGADVNTHAPHGGWTALHVAAGSPQNPAESARTLVQLGADPAAVDEDGWQPLHWAAMHDSAEGVEGLLSAVQKRAGLEAVAALLATPAAGERGGKPLEIAQRADAATSAACLQGWLKELEVHHVALPSDLPAPAPFVPEAESEVTLSSDEDSDEDGSDEVAGDAGLRARNMADDANATGIDEMD